MFGSLLGSIGGFLSKNIGSIAGVAGSLLGGKQASNAASSNNQLNYEHQKEFAQHGIRWKAADAKAAGLHPLAAIGGTGASYTPSSSVVGDSGYGSAANYLGDAASSFIDGQNTKRAQNATATQHERELADLALERAKLQNRHLEALITSEWASTMGQPHSPPMPTAVNPGAKSAAMAIRGNTPALSRSGIIEGQPSVAISPSAGDSSIEAGKNPLWKSHQLAPGLSIQLPSQSASEGLEALPPGALSGFIAYDALNKTFKGRNKPTTPLPPEYRWEWSILSQSWKPVRDSSAKYRKNLGITRGR